MCNILSVLSLGDYSSLFVLLLAEIVVPGEPQMNTHKTPMKRFPISDSITSITSALFTSTDVQIFAHWVINIDADSSQNFTNIFIREKIYNLHVEESSN